MYACDLSKNCNDQEKIVREILSFTSHHMKKLRTSLVSFCNFYKINLSFMQRR